MKLFQQVVYEYIYTETFYSLESTTSLNQHRQMPCTSMFFPYIVNRISYSIYQLQKLIRCFSVLKILHLQYYFLCAMLNIYSILTIHVLYRVLIYIYIIHRSLVLTMGYVVIFLNILYITLKPVLFLLCCLLFWLKAVVIIFLEIHCTVLINNFQRESENKC